MDQYLFGHFAFRKQSQQFSRKSKVLLTNDAGLTNQLSSTLVLPHTVQKNWLQVDHCPKFKSDIKNHRDSLGSQREKFLLFYFKILYKY